MHKSTVLGVPLQPATMTTFTKVAESEPHVISINPSHKISKIDDNTYGGFTEYVPFVI